LEGVISEEMIDVQLLRTSLLFSLIIFIINIFCYDQPLDLFFYMSTLNFQWLILKEIVRVIQKLYESCARYIYIYIHFFFIYFNCIKYIIVVT
jgi:hypothetical protein